MKGLDKYLVIDLTRGDSGAVCTEYLALAGMNVIRVEAPLFGEVSRAERADFIAKNLNKKTVTADGDTAEGAELIRRLAAKADVIVVNDPVSALVGRNLDYESVKQTNPDVVYISIQPYTSGSRWEGLPADRSIINAMSGATYQCGDWGCEPVEPGADLPDIMSCAFAAMSAASALYSREGGGGGRFIEVSQMDSVIAMGRSSYEKYYRTKQCTRSGNLLMNCSPTGLYKAKDGEVAIMCLAEPDFAPLCAAMGMPELAEDPRFKTQQDRVKNRTSIDRIVSDWAANYSKWDIMKNLLAKHRFICSVVYSPDDIAEAEDLRAMGLMQCVKDEVLGEGWLPVFPAVSDAFAPVAAAPRAITPEEAEKEGL